MIQAILPCNVSICILFVIPQSSSDTKLTPSQPYPLLLEGPDMTPLYLWKVGLGEQYTRIGGKDWTVFIYGVYAYLIMYPIYELGRAGQVKGPMHGSVE